MKPLTEKLFRTYVRLDGMKVQGFVATSALGNSQVQKIPFRLFCVRTPALVQVGDVILMPRRELCLLLEHPSDNEWSQQFKIAFLKHRFVWKRPELIVDPVTGFKKDTGNMLDLGFVYADFNTPLDETVLAMTDTEYRFLTGSDVRVKDRIGDKFVNKVTRVLGVNMVYAS